MPLPTTSNVTRPRSLGYDVRIESNYYRLIPPLGIQEEAAKNPLGKQLIRNPEDVARISEEILPLSQVDFSGGEGLDFGHKHDNTDFDQTRFWSSDAINVVQGHGDVQKLELAKDFSIISNQTDAGTASRQSPQMVEAGESLFMVGNAGDNTLVTRIDDPGGTPSSTAEDPHGTAAGIFSIAEVDGEVFVSIDGVGIYKRNTSGTWAAWNTNLSPVRIWGLKGRLVGVGSQGNIREITETTQPTPVTFGGDAVGLCATDAGAAILVGASNGYVYALADVDGDLTLRAQTSFQGEEVTAIGAGPSGIVLVGTGQGTTSRLYMGELGSSYTIQNMQMLREWEVNNDNHAHVSHIYFTRDSAYFAIRTSTPEFQLWKFDVTTTGLFHVWSSTTPASVTGIRVLNDKTFFSTNDFDAYGEQDTYQSSGYLISPLFDHFTSEDKVWAAAKFFGVDFPTNTSAELFYSTNPDAIEDDGHAAWRSVKSLTSIDDTEALISNASSRWIAFKIELSTTDTASTPQVRGYSSRAYTGAGDITIPLTINCSDRLERRGRKPKTIPGLGEDIYDQLKTLEGSAVEVELLWNSEIFEGTVRSVGHRSPAITERGSQLLVSQVEFVGRRQ